jgi:hypothetical protein
MHGLDIEVRREDLFVGRYSSVEMKRDMTLIWLRCVLAFLFLGNIYDMGGTRGSHHEMA